MLDDLGVSFAKAGASARIIKNAKRVTAAVILLNL